jgi:Protein kinase domain
MTVGTRRRGTDEVTFAPTPPVPLKYPRTPHRDQIVSPLDTGKQDNSMRESPIPNKVIYQQVSHILASQAFRKSIRLRRLLEFIVDTTVKGEATSLKEWVIGTDVYNRGPDFDPRLDPIVRTEIRRLRRKLGEYFETEGREDPILIEVPKGSYIPSFRERRNDDLFKLPGENIGDYFVLDRLNESFDTVTYRVRHNSSDRVLALRVISVEALARPGVRQTLEADVAAATVLRHENLEHVYGLQYSVQSVCVITEYFEGQKIADLIDRNALTWEQTLDIALQLISGLAAAHRLRVVHGNLNVSNVVVALGNAGERPALQILDFGMRSLAGTKTGHRLHLSPNELDAGAVHERNDVCGVGAVLHELFAGSVKERETDAAEWRKEVPEEKRSGLAAVLARCLAASPADRYADAREVEDALAFLGIDPCPRVGDTNECSDALDGKSQKWVWRYHAIPRIALRNLIAAALICILLILVAGAKEWVTPSVGTNTVRRLALFPVKCPPGNQECEAWASR